MNTRIIKVSDDKDAAGAARSAARALLSGKLVGFATETVYGIGALATSKEAVERIRELKSRPKRPFSVHLGRKQDVSRYVEDIPFEARRLIRKAWPGPVTILLPVGSRLADKKLNNARLRKLLCPEGVIGLRCPDEPVARSILRTVDGPVVAASANLAGERSARSADDVLGPLDGRIDLLIDSGPTRYGKDSTIVEFGASGWSVVRKGVYDEGTIRRLMRLRMLFVCTGNTCRSPMAVGLAKELLARRLGCSLSQLEQKGIEVTSAGVLAASGCVASREAIKAAEKMGTDISQHRSRKLSTNLIKQSDLIFCMKKSHVDEVRRMSPAAGEKVEKLDPDGDIEDPIGSGTEIYERCAMRIESALKHRLEEVVL